LLAWGALLGVIPIIIYIIFRRRYRIVRWAAMEILLRAVRKRYRNVRLQDLILMALRVLALGQVVGAAALASAITVGAFVVQGILGQTTPWAGAATATVTVGNPRTFRNAPAISLEKTASPLTYSAVGAVIDYSYKLTNSGNVTLAGPFTVTDDKSTDEACPATASLAPDAFITCSAHYTITQADLNAGSVKNVAQGHGFFGTAPVNSNEDDETVTAVKTEGLSLVKTASPLTYSAVGQVIGYSYLVANIGNVSLAGPVVIADDKSTNETCPAVSTVGNLDGFLNAGVDTPPLHALKTGVSGGNGVYGYGASGTFPTLTYRSLNYWVDVVFSAGPAPTLTSIAVTPSAPTLAVGATQQFTATGTYSDGSTQDLTPQVTWASSSPAVSPSLRGPPPSIRNTISCPSSPFQLHACGGIGARGLFGEPLHACFRHGAAPGRKQRRGHWRHGGRDWRHVNRQAGRLHSGMDQKLLHPLRHRRLGLPDRAAYHSPVAAEDATDEARPPQTRAPLNPMPRATFTFCNTAP